MPARSVLHALVALLALLASDPFHSWLHSEHGVEFSGAQEIHDGACGHLPEHPGGDDCQQCSSNHGLTVLLDQSSVCLGTLQSVAQGAPEQCASTHGSLKRSLLGARAPPVSG